MRPRASKRHTRGWQRRVLSLLLIVLACVWATPVFPDSPHAERGLDPILSYISSGWDTLTRSLTKCGTVVDPKMTTAAVLYLPADYPMPDSARRLEKECNVQVRRLPKSIHQTGEIDASQVDPPGLLYLENPYVVPGGRFNEMYGWDSYFIILGLLRAGRVELAQGMVENLFFEIGHYGTVLNANRTYYLTRSQPPFLTSMILAVYDAQTSAGHEERSWLAKAYEYAVKDYGTWTREPHLAGSTGLSRYYDFGEGPVPEGLKDETAYYRKVAAFFLAHPEANRDYLILKGSGQTSPLTLGPQYSMQVCGDGETAKNGGCEAAADIALSGEYYKGDRAMRESGFDVSFRFGAYGAATHHYAPVCLNSLLYKTERDLARMSEILARHEEREKWTQRAEERKERILKYLWDGERGLFFDYDFEKRTRSAYEYAVTFYPLWAGVATTEQARSVVKNLGLFERPGGIVMSRRETGVQWDYPYVWAPIQLLTVEGLRRYGFNEEGNRIAYEFLSMVTENFRRDGTIREKYNGVTRSSEIGVTAGYKANVVGFGWTNGVFLELLHELPNVWVKRL